MAQTHLILITIAALLGASPVWAIDISCLSSLRAANDNNQVPPKAPVQLHWKDAEILHQGITHRDQVDYARDSAISATAVGQVYAVNKNSLTTISFLSKEKQSLQVRGSSLSSITHDSSFLVSQTSASSSIFVHDLNQLTVDPLTKVQTPALVLSFNASASLFGLLATLTKDPRSAKEYLSILDAGSKTLEIYELEAGKPPLLFIKQNFKSMTLGHEILGQAFFNPVLKRLVLFLGDVGVSNIPQIFVMRKGRFIPGPKLQYSPSLSAEKRKARTFSDDKLEEIGQSLEASYSWEGGVSASGRYIFGTWWQISGELYPDGSKKIDGIIDVYSGFSGKFIRRFEAPVQLRGLYAVSKNEDFFAVSGSGNKQFQIYIFSLKPGSGSEPIAILEGLPGVISSLNFAAEDGSVLVSTGFSGNVVKWDLSKLVQ